MYVHDNVLNLFNPNPILRTVVRCDNILEICELYHLDPTLFTLYGDIYVRGVAQALASLTDPPSHLFTSISFLFFRNASWV